MSALRFALSIAVANSRLTAGACCCFSSSALIHLKSDSELAMESSRCRPKLLDRPKKISCVRIQRNFEDKVLCENAWVRKFHRCELAIASSKPPPRSNLFPRACHAVSMTHGRTMSRTHPSGAGDFLIFFKRANETVTEIQEIRFVLGGLLILFSWCTFSTHYW